MSNIITAKFKAGQTSAWADGLYQYDYGQILKFDGLELPEAYEVHFSDTPIIGDAKTQIGNADGVTIPDEYLQTGSTIYAWVFLHTGEDDGETEYSITVPVTKRPKPTDEAPTPQEQSAIDQAIAALNIAVEKADEAITHYPRIEGGAWRVWDVTEQAYVDTGVEATGQKGDKGDPGENGDDGYSPTITVTDIAGGHRVTITDKNGTQTVDVMNGSKGDPGAPGAKGDPGDNGISPTVTVTEITGGHRVAITDASGTHTFDVMDGQDGSVTVDDALSDTSTNPVQNKVIAKEITDVKEDLSKKVDDVQINGSSILDGGVANIPMASPTKLGAVKIPAAGAYDFGVSINNSGYLYINKATENQTKNGINTYKPITPLIQHQSTFYGLTKAAGVDMAQSANPVGQYTDEAKIAIQKMLGIYEPPYELIYEETLTNESGIGTISTDLNGEPLNLLSAFIQITYPANAASVTGGYSRFRAYDANSKYINTETGRYQTGTAIKYKLIHFKKESNVGIGLYQTQAGANTQGVWSTKSGSSINLASSGGVVVDFGNIVSIYEPSGDVEPAGTIIQVYGQKAY